jgi:2-C-methyl-D-erythritol 4-phosphate cytidylyltransferase
VPGSRPGLWAIIVAAGSGSRFGGEIPKQELDLGGRRVMDWSIRQFAQLCDGVVLVVRAESVDAETGRLEISGADQSARGIVTVVAGGSTRSQSVRSGLAAIPTDAPALAAVTGTTGTAAADADAGADSASDEANAKTVVLVHDAARPFVPAAVVEALLAAIDAGADAAIPGVAVVDTIKRISGGFVVETPPRSDLVAVQTPQAFRLPVLRAVHAGGAEATDDAALVEASGGRVAVIAGSDDLRKVTTVDDLAWLRGRLGSWQ